MWMQNMQYPGKPNGHTQTHAHSSHHPCQLIMEWKEVYKVKQNTNHPHRKPVGPYAVGGSSISLHSLAVSRSRSEIQCGRWSSLSVNTSPQKITSSLLGLL